MTESTLCFVLYTRRMFSGLSGIDIGIIFVSIVVSMTFHEAMHGFTAHWRGDSTAKDLGRLTLNPLKHSDLWTTVLLPIGLILLGLPPFFIARPVPFNPNRVKWHEYGAALIGISGPLTNLLLAIVTSIVLRTEASHMGLSVIRILVLFIDVNIAFFVFNMIPFPPLDGSRLLYAFAPEPVQEFMARIESGGLTYIFIFMFVVIFMFGNILGNIEQHLLSFLIG